MLQRSPTYIGIAARRRPVHRADQQDAAGEGRLRAEPVEEPSCSRPPSTRSPASFPNFMRKQLMTMAERRLPEGYDVEKHFGPQLQPVGPATVPGAQRRSVQDHPHGQGRRRHRHHRRASPRPGIKLASGEELRRRHHRHRNGFEPAAVRRRDDHAQRRADRPERHDGLQGHDADRHAEHGVHHRLHQRVVDAEGRPGLRVRLPRAELHGRQRLRHRRARSTRATASTSAR